jgi:hypothetical protein
MLLRTAESFLKLIAGLLEDRLKLSGLSITLTARACRNEWGGKSLVDG